MIEINDKTSRQWKRKIGVSIHFTCAQSPVTSLMIDELFQILNEETFTMALFYVLPFTFFTRGVM